MTFTEAAVEILRLVGKPLHYKKITEIAIERNLLSHVGKTPEITMSSRLATMVRKDRGEAPVVKVKAGVFGLREFSEEVLEAAQKESGHNVSNLPPVEAAEEKDEGEAKKPAELTNHPGADVFPEEADDDEPILASIERETKERREKRDRDGEEDGEGRRKRRRRRGAKRDDEERGRERGGRKSRRSKRKSLEGDWERTSFEGDSAGKDLADAIASAMGRHGRTLHQIAESLVSKGRLQGDPAALAPTVSAAIRGDDARRAAQGLPARFVADGDEFALRTRRLPGDVKRSEQDLEKLAGRQRDSVRRAFMKSLAELPSASLLELLATWLNAVGVVGVRGVRRPGSSRSEFHLAGTLRQGPLEIPLAIVVARSAELSREMVVEARGALHHYGDARAVWLVSTGQCMRGAREEASAGTAAPVALFDGATLAESMESVGVGLRRYSVPLSTIDFALLDSLRGPGYREESDEEPSEEAQDDEAKGEESGESEGGERKRRRRRRRRGGDDEEAAAEESGDESASNEGEQATSEEEDVPADADANEEEEASEDEGPSSDEDAPVEDADDDDEGDDEVEADEDAAETGDVSDEEEEEGEEKGD